MPRNGKRPEDTEEAETGDKLIEHVALVEGEFQDISLDVCQYQAYAPTLRVRRVVVGKGGNKFKSLGALKSEAEARDLGLALAKGAKALGKALS